LSEFLLAVSRAGETLGMELHWDKFQLLGVQCSLAITNPSGQLLLSTTKLQYLGAAISEDGLCDNELSRRIGIAKGQFLALVRLWKHSALSLRRRLHFYSALVESRLLYGLVSVCLKVAQARRLDGFQNRCLRTILGVKPSFISRISNAEVLRRAGLATASNCLLKRQMVLFGKVIRSACDGPLQTVCFIPGTLRPATERYVRRVGRPRKEWIPTLLETSISRFGSLQRVEALAANGDTWRRNL
jgi:hypothetical protein